MTLDLSNNDSSFSIIGNGDNLSKTNSGVAEVGQEENQCICPGLQFMRIIKWVWVLSRAIIYY